MKDHLISIEEDLFDPGYTACCACGWRGHLKETQDEAVEEMERHLDSIREPV